METEEEPRTAITRKVEKAVEDSELKRDRRWHDKIYNDVIKPMIIPIIIGISSTIIAIVTASLWMWVDINTMKIEYGIMKEEVEQLRKVVSTQSANDNKAERLETKIEQLIAELKQQQSGVGRQR